jgi:hypothetical protein
MGGTALATHERGTLADQSIDGDGVVPVVGGLVADAIGDERVVRRHRCRTGHAVDAPGFGQQVGATDDHLRRDAAVVRALAADEMALDADDTETLLSQRASHCLPTGAKTNDDDIDCVFGHGVQSVTGGICYVSALDTTTDHAPRHGRESHEGIVRTSRAITNVASTAPAVHQETADDGRPTSG